MECEPTWGRSCYGRRRLASLIVLLRRLASRPDHAALPSGLDDQPLSRRQTEDEMVALRGELLYREHLLLVVGGQAVIKQNNLAPNKPRPEKLRRCHRGVGDVYAEVQERDRVRGLFGEHVRLADTHKRVFGKRAKPCTARS